MTFQFTYQTLPDAFYQSAIPDTVSNAESVAFNQTLAEKLNLSESMIVDWLTDDWSTGQVHGAKPIAQAYAGHQFGQLNMLGDGRALLLGEVKTDSGLMDVQLKGSGRTPYSRQGDGKANLAPMLREYLMSEAMHALGIPTTRSLAVLKTGEAVRRREHRQGAVLVRVASSHIRVGTFAYAMMASYQKGDLSLSQALLDYTIQRHYPELAEQENPALALLDKVIAKQIELVAHWQRVGFVHGVLNTDNVTVSGETIDYGPCAFMDAYSPATVFSSIDHDGRYAFGNQPPITHWNMMRFAECLLPLIDKSDELAIELATNSLKQFEPNYQAHWQSVLFKKLGFSEVGQAQIALAEAFLALLSDRQLDYTNSFIALTQCAMDEENALPDDETFHAWLSQWQAQLTDDSLALMQSHNPIIIPRNHLVESALNGAEQGDLSLFHELNQALASPYDWDNLNKYTKYQKPADQDRTAQYQTFCGT